MKARLAEVWSSFPAEHKKRFYQGLACYGALVFVTATWIGFRADDTVKDWRSRIPSSNAVIQDIQISPQAAETEALAPSKAGSVVSLSDGKTRISIIVLGLGLSDVVTKMALNELPPQVSVAFSPYADGLQDWIQKAGHLNRESLVLMPMESSSYPQEDPGPRAISSRFSDKDNEDNMNWLFNQSKGSVGVINLMGSRFLSDRRRLSPIFDTLEKRKSMFIETPGIDKSQAAVVAAETGLPYLAADLKIDTVATDKEIRKQLAVLEGIARDRGYAIGVAGTYPLTFTVLKSWASGLKSRGITLASLESVWKNKPRHEETSSQSSASQPPSQEQLQQPRQ